jgi:hypothetical protein
MRGAGGTDGGIGMFIAGFALAAGSLWFFFDSVLVTSGGVGWITGQLAGSRSRSGGLGVWQTASMGIIFIPFLCGVVALFYDASKSWAWYLTYFGLFVLVVEILSRIQFVFSMKTSHMLLMLVSFAAGTAMMFRSYRSFPDANSKNGNHGGK